MYFLDSNTCIYFLNGSSESIRRKILSTPPNEIKIPSLVKAELLLGAYKSKNPQKTQDQLEQFLEPFEVTPFDEPVCYEYAAIRKQTEEEGKIVGPNDLLIAAITRFHDGTLVTRNTKEFGRIEGLKIETWWNN
ncbi:MAG: type II toxin-antitoxin system VapC family toxin [Spirochaetales bacterium]|nr:type II toxin-antitoxin system VapC family toxin [Spirochaetales bacterium]